MENNLNDNPVSVVEKVSMQQIKQVQSELKSSENKTISNLIEAACALNDEEIDKAIAFLDKKLEMLKKLNKK